MPNSSFILKDTPFLLSADYSASGDQPQAIDKLTEGIASGERHHVLLGVTGSGKTFTMANVIARLNRPTIVLAHNKTLAGQLYGEFRALFPQNAVEYFVSYYDYYQPEAYIPQTDTHIDKDSSVNDAIDLLRLSATRSLFERRDVLIVSSVSCIYGLGSPEAYYGMVAFLEAGKPTDRDQIIRKLIEIHYERSEVDFTRGNLRVRGDVLEIFPAYEEEKALRVEFWGDEVASISEIDPLRGKVLRRLPRVAVLPASHYVVDQDRRDRAMETIKEELKERVEFFRQNQKLLEAQRIDERTTYDLEMIAQMGYCNGIENYSRHLTGRAPGEPPPCLLDFMPKDWLLFVDESHVTLPQVQGMYRGDRSRKQTLVEFGFRLPSALDNRPLTYEEFESRLNQVVYVSATPGDHELHKTGGVVVEQVIRPTGLVDPVILRRPAQGQVDDLLAEIRECVARKQRVLVTTLTKRMAEELTDYYSTLGVAIRYMHSDIDALERMSIIRDLRLGEFDVLVGINLLREGLDIPEVALVAILDADKEGFLRSTRSLIQTMGRAARHLDGRVILYADTTTDSILRATDETERRRQKQTDYNRLHGITPTSIVKEVLKDGIYAEGDYLNQREEGESRKKRTDRSDERLTETGYKHEVARLEKLMRQAATQLQFEKAAEARDQIKELKRRYLLEAGSD